MLLQSVSASCALTMALYTADALTVNDILHIIDTEQHKAVKKLHRPKGREVFIFDTEDGSNS